MVKSTTTRTEFLDTLHSEAEELGVDPILADAIITAESAWNPYAIRFERDFNYFVNVEKLAQLNKITADTEKNLQKFSFGLGQVMGGTARWLGYVGPLTALCEPDFGIEYCLKHLHHLSSEYSRHEDIAAAYNAGSVRYDEKGQYFNRWYVDRVMGIYAGLLKAK